MKNLEPKIEIQIKESAFYEDRAKYNLIEYGPPFTDEYGRPSISLQSRQQFSYDLYEVLHFTDYVYS